LRIAEQSLADKVDEHRQEEHPTSISLRSD